MNILHAPNTLSKSESTLKCENVTTLAQNHNARSSINDIKLCKLILKLTFIDGYSNSIQKVLSKICIIYNASIKNDSSCRPSNEYLAKVTGLSLSAVKRAVSWLKDQNVISIKIIYIGVKSTRIITDIGGQKLRSKNREKLRVRNEPLVNKENTKKKKVVGKVSNRNTVKEFEKLVKPLFNGHPSYRRFLDYWSNDDGTVSLNLHDISNVKNRIKKHISVNAYAQFKELLTDGKYKIFSRQFRLVEDLLLEFKGIPEKDLISRLKSLGSDDMRAVFKEAARIHRNSSKVTPAPSEGFRTQLADGDKPADLSSIKKQWGLG